MTFHPNLVLAGLALLAVLGLALTAWRGRTGPKVARRIDLRRLGMAVLVLLIAVRPVVGGQQGRGLASNVDVVIMVDRTTSIAAEDWNGAEPRVRGVAHDIRKIAERYPGARFAIVTFTSRGVVEMPFTTDATALLSVADSIVPELYLYSAGSSISAGVATTEKLLRDAEKAQPGRTRQLFYLGDGEQTSKEPVESFAALKPLIRGGGVLGYGTAAGGRMKTGITENGYVHAAGGDAVSKIDEGNLRKVAGELGVDYQHRARPDQPNLPSAGGWSTALGDARVTSGMETYWMFALALLGLVLWELWDAATVHRRLRTELGVRTRATKLGIRTLAERAPRLGRERPRSAQAPRVEAPGGSR
ncbi:vWA domain-containing protein [Mariniluteicoccus flavus]